MKKKKIILSIIFFFLFLNFAFAQNLTLDEKIPSLKHLYKTHTFSMNPDMGTLEAYKSSDGYCDTYFFKNTAYIPVEVKVKLQDSSYNVDALIPDIIKVPARGSAPAFKVQAKDKNQSWSYQYLIPEFKLGCSTSTHTGDSNYYLPFKKGSSYKVLQGENGLFTHYGDNAYAIDFDMPQDTEICAIRDGIVIFVKQSSNEGGPYKKEYREKGNCIWIIHDDGTIAIYYHLRQNSSKVKIGDNAKAGDIIGYSGNTGFSTQPHLHLQLFLFKGLSGFECIPIRFKEQDGALIDGESYTAQ